MSKQTSHPVKAQSVTTLFFHFKPVTTQVHATGCAHASKADSVGASRSLEEFNEVLAANPDDFFFIAPCARKATV